MRSVEGEATDPHAGVGDLHDLVEDRAGDDHEIGAEGDGGGEVVQFGVHRKAPLPS